MDSLIAAKKTQLLVITQKKSICNLVDGAFPWEQSEKDKNNEKSRKIIHLARYKI